MGNNIQDAAMSRGSSISSRSSSDTPQPIPIFDPLLHLSYRPNSILKEIELTDLGLNEVHKEHLEIMGDGAIKLFSFEAVQIMKNELIQYVLSQSQKVSDKNYIGIGPNLKDCANSTPFVYSALTHSRTAECISAIAGMELSLNLDFETAHIALIDDTTTMNHRLLNINNRKLIGWNNVPYPFLCLIKLTTNHIDDRLPVGFGTVLQGRLTENIALKQIEDHLQVNRNTNHLSVVLMISFKPADIIKHEDERFLLNSFKSDHLDQVKKARLTISYVQPTGKNKKQKKQKKEVHQRIKLSKRKYSTDSSETYKKLKIRRDNGKLKGIKNNHSSDEESCGVSNEEIEEVMNETESSEEDVSQYASWLQNYYDRSLARYG